MSELTQYHKQRLGTLRSDRSNFDTQWEEAASRLIPADVNAFTGRGMNQTAGSQGQKNTELMFDATAAFACQRFSAVMESLVTPQGSIWNIFKALDPVLKRNRQVKMFFDDLATVLHDWRYRPAGNFVDNSQQVYVSLGAYGNGTMYIDTPEKKKGLRYRFIHLGESYFVRNHARIVDTMYRPYMQTARQIAQRWGDKAPDAIKEQAKSSTQAETKSECLHVVQPRADADPNRMDAKGMPFESVYMHIPTNTILDEGGFRVFPYATACYTQGPGEDYGRGPAQWVLPSIKILNEQKKTSLKQGHRQTDPVLLAHDDGNLGSFSMKPGALNAGGVNKDGRPLIHAMPVGSLAINEKMMDIEKSIINDAFLITLFQILIDTPQMTATEVLERAREKGWLLAPISGKLQAGWLGPMIEREIDLLAFQGLMPKMPAILLDASVEYKIEYDNPMSRMAQAEKAAGFMRALGVAADYAKMTGDVSPLDWFNFDVAMPEVLDIHGAPTRWTSSQDEVDAKRGGRAQAQQQQQMIEAAPSMAALAKAAPAGAPAK